MKSFFTKLSVGIHALVITMGVSIISLVKMILRKNQVEVVNARLLYWSRMLLKKGKITCHVNDPHKLELEKGRPYIYMCNHTSLYDIPIALTTLPGSIRMLVKKELTQIPVWGKAMLACGFISIDRQNNQQAYKDMLVAKEAMKKGTVLWIAPEGTRSKDGKLLPFKKGGFRLAIDTGATIVPIGISGAYNILPAGSLEVNVGKSVTVNIGKPINASEYSNRTRGKLLKSVENEIREMTNQIA